MGGLPSGRVTVLFTDIEGSTALLRRLGERYDALLADHFAILRAAIGTHGGVEVRTKGDEIFAVFADAAEAVAACASAQQALGAHDWPINGKVRVRMGLHTGDVHLSGGDYVGLAVHQAARIFPAAHGGQVVCSSATAEACGEALPDGVGLMDLGLWFLRDFEGSERLHQVVAENVQSSFPPLRAVPAEAETVAPPVPVLLAAPAASALTGRDDELARLRSEWQQACAPTLARPRHVVLVNGEPGIGKTRLVAELALFVAQAGGHVHYGRCDENGAAPFLPWLAVLDGLVAQTPTEMLAELRADVAELQRLCPQLAKRLELPPARVGDLESERARLFEAIEHILISASQPAPLLVVLDDLHWADRSSLLLLTRLGSVGVRGRFLLVGTFRDTELERSHPLSTALGELSRERRLQRLPLRGLDRDATASLIGSRSGHEPDSGLAAAVFAQTEGHPFFVEELCAHLIETGGAQVRGTRLTATEDLRRAGIPAGVRDVLGRRFERLSSEATETLRVGAVMGPVFDIAVLERLRPDPDSVLKGIEEALGAGLVRERAYEFGRYEFCHALVRGALVEDVSSVRRVRLHRSIADAIESLTPAPSASDVDLLAYHYAEAAADGDVAKAAEYACRAAEEATDRAAYDEASAYLERGLEIVAFARGDGTVAQAELLIARAELMWRTAGYQEATTAVAMEAAALARAAQEPSLFARAVCVRGWYAHVLDREFVSLADEALQWLGDSDLPRALQLRIFKLFHRVFHEGLHPGDEAESRALVEAARNTGDWRVLLYALMGAIGVLRGHPDLDGRRRYAEELRELTADHNDVFFLGQACQDLASINLALADRTAFLRDLEALRRLSAGVGPSEFMVSAEIGATTDALVSGCFAEADDRIKHLLKEHREQRWPGAVASSDSLDVLTAQLFWLRAEQGRLDEIERTLTTMESLVETHSVVVPMLAFARARLGQTEVARIMLRSAAVDEFARLRRGPQGGWGWPLSLAMLAEAAVLIGDESFRSQLHHELEHYRGQLLSLRLTVCVGAADRYLAMLAQAEGRTQEALTGFARAFEIEGRLPSPPLLARTQFWWGSALATRPHESVETRRMLDGCVEAATSLGMRDLAYQARARRETLTPQR